MDHAGAPAAEHAGIRTIGRLVLFCAVVLLVSVGLLLATALQIMRSIDQADLDSERRRAANTIDIMVAQSGPLTQDSAETLGTMAGLADAHLSTSRTTAANLQQVPLLAGTGPSGSYLTWTRSPVAERIFREFAPVRLPIISGMLLLVLALLLRLRRVVGDIERQRRLAHRQSRSDVVTGLANRLAFDTLLDEFAAGEQPLALIVFDLDRFKSINDAFGHAAGDTVLQAVGARLSRLLGPHDLLARIGGDEFALLSRSHTLPGDLERLALACIASVEAPVQLAGRAVRVGVSLGIVPSAAPHDTPARLVAQADTALYRAKAQPGSAYMFAGGKTDVPAEKQRLTA